MWKNRGKALLNTYKKISEEVENEYQNKRNRTTRHCTRSTKSVVEINNNNRLLLWILIFIQNITEVSIPWSFFKLNVFFL